ncbi:MAG: hypothetical protein M0P58_08015 [Bacteroidales bacterium]|nr:hypothetical protein [Bacteroidales bacterium]
MGIIFEYPSGYLLLCLLTGALYAFFLYYFDKKRKTAPRLIWILMAFRFITVSIIAILLLSPLIRRNIKTIEKPIVIIGVDNSASICLSGDSTYYHTRYLDQINRLIAALQKKCEVKTYSFGERVTMNVKGTFSEKETDIASFFEEVENRFSNRNTGVLIIASDGLYNKGIDPFYAAQKISFPVFSIALGDTTVKKDALIRKITVSKTVFKGDQFPVEVITEMDKLQGAKSTLKLKQGAQLLSSKELVAREGRSQNKSTFLIQTTQSGVFKYTLQIDPLAGEANTKNNRVDFFVEVMDTRQKVAILYNAPHPDITTLVKAMEGSSRFDVKQVKINDFNPTTDKSDLIILYQLPAISGLANLNELMKTKTSMFFVLGSQSDLNAFNNLKTGLIITSKPGNFTEVQATTNKDFPLFTLEKDDPALFSSFPPLQSPFGVYQSGPMAEVLFYQRSGSVTTSNPLAIFLSTQDRKVGVVTGENLWRWRIANYIQEKNTDAFDRLINKMVHYLAVKEDKSFFRIKIENRYDENDPVEIEAEVYNSSYELINDPEVDITITDSENKKYPFIFNRTNHAYFLNIGILPAGSYSFAATTRVGNTRYQQNGKFFIEPVNNEYFNLVADHQLLYRISKAHDGEVVYPNQMDSLVNKIIHRDDFKTVSIYEKRFTDLIGSPWLFILIATLLTMEWVIRKREGM